MLNQIQIIGRLGRDPESKFFDNGGQITNIAVACSERWKDKQTGEQKESTEWFRVVFRDKLAEVAANYLMKGSLVYVQGKQVTRKYSDKDGIERTSVELHAREMKMLSARNDNEGGQQPQQQAPRQAAAPQQAPRQSAPQQRQAPAPQRQQAPQQYSSSSGFDDMDDDIPF